MIERARALLPALVVVVALTSAAESPPLLAALGFVLTALAVVGPRVEVDRERQVLTSVIGAGAGYLVAALVHEALAGALGEGWTRIGSALVCAGAVRALLVRPLGERRPELVLWFLALLVAGRSDERTYPALVVAFLLAALWMLGTPTARALDARRAAGALAIAGLATLLGGGSTLGLRHAHSLLRQRVGSSAFTWRPQVGFGERMDLGSLDGLLDSDRIVMRVRGEHVDYLRGAVLDLYETGRWLRSHNTSAEQPATARSDAAGPRRAQIQALSARHGRVFLPLEAADVTIQPADVLVDDLGNVKLAARHAVPSVELSPGPRQWAAPAPPSPVDLQLPSRLLHLFRPLALEWTRDAQTIEEQLGALERRLRRDYSYSRSFQRLRGVDPVAQFLLRDGRGHCEYFASALALLTRSLGIPARTVTGYRVGEKSPFGYWVVRERNAHAWVEAWVPERGWVTLDATPSEALPHNLAHEAGYLASALDGVRVGYDELTAWLEDRSVRETAIAWLVGLALLALVVARGARRRARAAAALDDERALPCLERLLEALEREGHGRAAHEPLERLAERVPDREAAQLLARYGALRYGGRGDPSELLRDMEIYTAERARRPAPPRSGPRATR